MACVLTHARVGALWLALAGLAAAADVPAGLDKVGKPDLKSAQALAFGPKGVLFVGDPLGAQIFAIGVTPPASAVPIGPGIQAGRRRYQDRRPAGHQGGRHHHS